MHRSHSIPLRSNSKSRRPLDEISTSFKARPPLETTIAKHAYGSRPMVYLSTADTKQLRNGKPNPSESNSIRPKGQKIADDSNFHTQDSTMSAQPRLIGKEAVCIPRSRIMPESTPTVYFHQHTESCAPHEIGATRHNPIDWPTTVSCYRIC